MPKTVASVNLLQAYLQGVMDRAEHHANNVDEVSLTIAGAVVWRKDGEIEYSKQRIRDAPDTPYAVRQENLSRVDAVAEKLRLARKAAKS